MFAENVKPFLSKVLLLCLCCAGSRTGYAQGVSRTEPRPIGKCSDFSDFKDFDPCKSPLDGAPSLLVTRTAFFSFWDMAYAKACPKGGCLVDISGPNLLKGIDYLELQKRMVGTLASKGKQIAFRGYSSGEVLVTTVPERRPDKVAYYQVRIVARSCPGRFEMKDPCGLYASASYLQGTNDALGAMRQNWTFAADGLCRELEELVEGYIYELMAQGKGSQSNR